MATCPVCKGDFDAHYCPRDGNRLLDEHMLGDRYRLLRKVGEGSMGEVFEAEHVHLSRRVAVKLLQRKIASNPEAAARLQREARSTTGLGHPNIVDTIDFGFADGQTFLVMEWLEGENLDARLARGPIDLPTAIEIASQTAAGVAAAHERGVIHRDLKPANLFLTRDHRGQLLVKVLDFGIAKLALHETKLTATGVLVGTPNYMAPEQAEGNPVDARTDVYALGVILYEMLTGTVPFQGETPLSVLHQHTSRLPILPSARAPERAIPEALDDLVMRCLAKAPDDRFPTMQALCDALANVGGKPSAAAAAGVSSSARPPAPTTRRFADDDEPVVTRRRRRILPLALLGAAVVLAGVLVIIATHHSSRPERPAVARADAAIAAATDASPIVAPGSDASVSADAAIEGLTVALHGRRANGTLVVHPALPIAGERIELAVQLSDLDPKLGEAAAAGKLMASVEVEYYKTDTLVAPPLSIPVDKTWHFAVSVPIAHATKHHVHIDLIVDGAEVDHLKADLWPDLH